MGLNERRRLPWRMPRVLMYHNFGETPAAGDPEMLFVSEPMLRAQLALLRRRGWRALSLDEFLAALDGAPTPRKAYLLTIDDGHDSVLRTAVPILAQAGIPSVLFVPPAVLGGPVSWNPAYAAERLSSPAEISSLAGSGMEVGVHGYDHSRMFGMDAEALDRNVVRARDEVETIMGRRPRSFAYPYGTHDENARRALADAGYDVSFAVAREHGRFAVDRVFVKSTDSLLVFRFKLSLAYRFASRVGGRMPWLRHRARAVIGVLTGRRRPTAAASAARRAR